MDKAKKNRVLSWAEVAWKDHKKAEDALVEGTKNRLREIQKEILALEEEQYALESLLDRNSTNCITLKT